MFEGFPTEDEVVASWRGDREKPIVTFACLTYRHAAFVVDTFRGFINQRTTFPFEIICFDDCSPDNTRGVIDQFAERYPSIVRTVYPKTNQSSLGSKPIFDFVVPISEGRYLAMCEGDDFWSDPLKIQKQVDFLDNNPAYSIVNHDINTVDVNGNIVDENYLPDFYKKDFSSEEIKLAWSCVQVASMLFRNVIRDIPEEMRKAPSGDIFLSSLLGHFGKAKYLSDIKPAMYRQHGGGEFSPLPLSEKYAHQEMNFYWLHRYYRRIGCEHEARFFRLRHAERALRGVSAADIVKLVYLAIRPGQIRKVLMSLQDRRTRLPPEEHQGRSAG